MCLKVKKTKILFLLSETASLKLSYALRNLASFSTLKTLKSLKERITAKDLVLGLNTPK